MKRVLAIYVVLLVISLLLFGVLHLVYVPSPKVTLAYLLGTAITLSLSFYGERSRIAAITIGLLVLSQPFVTVFFNPEFHTLEPNFTITMNGDMLRGLDSKITVTTDSYGFRTTAPDAYTRRFKIFTVGASTTEQIYLDDSKTSSALLEKYLASPEYSVINTGLSGLRTIHHVATLRAIARFQPHAVIVLLGGNDWICAARGACTRPRMIRFDPQFWPLTQVMRSIESILFSPPAGEFGGRGLKSPREYYSTVMGKYEDKPKRELSDKQIEQYLDAFGGDLSELLATCERVVPHCIIATQPNGYRPKNFGDAEYVQSLWMTPPDADWALSEDSLVRLASSFNAYIRTHSTCANCLLFDLDQLMGGDRMFFYDDLHFNNDGADFVAQSLLTFVRSYGLAPPNE